MKRRDWAVRVKFYNHPEREIRYSFSDAVTKEQVEKFAKNELNINGDIEYLKVSKD